MYQVNFNVNNALNTPSIAADTFANRPAVAATGAVYIATDTGSMYRFNGSTWTSIGGGGISGSGTINKIPVWTSASALGDSDLVYTVPGAYPNKQIISGCSFESQYADPTINGNAAGYIVRRTANNTIVATLLGLDTTVTAAKPIFNTYAQDDYYLKIFGTANNYHSFFKNGNVVLNGFTDAGFKLDIQGSVRSSSNFRVDNSGTIRGDFYNTGPAANLDLYFGAGIGIKLDPSSNSYITGGATLSIGSTTGNAQSLLYLSSTIAGLRFPNMTTAQKNAISNVAGLVVFDTTLAKLCVNSGAGWQTITSV